MRLIAILITELIAGLGGLTIASYVDEYGNELLGIKPANARERKTLVLKKRHLANPEFKELWEKISQKTRYAVDIDADNLVKDCIEEIDKISIDAIKIEIEKVTLHLEGEGVSVSTKFVGKGSKDLGASLPTPNVLERIASETNLTRYTVGKILSRIQNLDLIFKNPQEFITSCIIIIKEKLEDRLVNGIQYHKVEDWYKMELFDDINTYSDMIIRADKTIYDGIALDSDIEKRFAEELNRMNNVKLFIKLPSWFQVETPIGTYNPDWAVVMEDSDQFGTANETLYFVTETKGTTDIHNLRPSEKRKIRCAKNHFESISATYGVVTNASQLKKLANSKKQ